MKPGLRRAPKGLRLDPRRRAGQNAHPVHASWKGLYLLVTRLLAPLCVALALLFFYDLATPATRADTARVVGKAQRLRRATRHFTVEAKGRYTYREDVSARLFRTIEVGDELRVSLSPVFTEWKTMEVVRNGRVIAAARGTELPEPFGMAAMGLLLLVGLAAFLPERRLFPERVLSAHPYMALLVITVPVLDFAALLLGLRLLQVWMGQIEKM